MSRTSAFFRIIILKLAIDLVRQLRNLIFLFLLFPTILLSQQDLFNVPNLDITPTGKFFSQTQIILYPDTTQCDCTIQYGLGNQQEIGVSIYNIFYPSNHSSNNLNNRLNHIPYVDPVITINYFKRWDLTKNLAIGAGTKFGGNFYTGNRKSNFAYFNHFDSAYEILQIKTKIHSGFYFGNEAYLGYFTDNFYPAKKMNYYGIMLGLEKEIIPGKLNFICDYISGINSMGVSVYGLTYFINSNLFLSAGYQIPNRGNGSFNAHAVVIELNAFF